MADINYTITFFSDWNCGSGLSAGSESDSQVKKNKDGLPYLPGRTTKGLLRDAARDLFEGDSDSDKFIEACFGQKKAEFDSGKPLSPFFFSNSEFTPDIANYFISHPVETRKLFRNIPSTSIDEETGVAKKEFLRTMEVAIPLTLTGFISNIPDDDVIKMHACLKMVKRLGIKRNRGLGRCQFNIVPSEKGGQP